VFTRNAILQVGTICRRHDVMNGSVFTYVDGTGTYYCTFGTWQGSYIGAKLNNSRDVASITATPQDSPNVRRNVRLEGIFNLALNFYDQPELLVLSASRSLTFGKILSLKGHKDKHGSPHLYMTMGNNAGQQGIEQHLLLKLTADDPELPAQSLNMFVELPQDSFVAMRGHAQMMLECREPRTF